MWAEEYKHSELWVDHWRADRVAMIWDQTFTMRYANFRRRLNEIQQENLREVRFDHVVNQYEYVRDDSIVVPTDDDDWFHPDLVPILQERPEPTYWNFINYTEGRIYVQNTAHDKMMFAYETNNYSLANPPNDLILRDHCHANQSLKGTHIDVCLSVHNRSMASLSILRDRLLPANDPHGELLAMYDTARKPVEVGRGVPEYFMGYVEKMLGVYRNELKVKRAFL